MLDEIKMIKEQRGEEYGDTNKSFGRIASLWSAYTGTNILPKDVAYMMALLKMSREKSGAKFDNRLDAATYCVLADEVSNAS